MSREFGFRELPADQLEKARDMGTRQFIRHLGIRSWKVPSLARRGLQLLHERIHTIEPIPGMPEVLLSLHGRGHRLGILTSNSEANVSAFLSRHEMPYFEFVRTSSKLFGKAREMRRFLKKEGAGSSDVLYVGDETRDVEAAREAGLAMAAVTWGYNSEQALSALDPQHILRSPGELLELMGGFQ
jgi:phosphoglycolate phosphatase-like HAD superfamily hydrolase